LHQVQQEHAQLMAHIKGGVPTQEAVESLGGVPPQELLESLGGGVPQRESFGYDDSFGPQAPESEELTIPTESSEELLHQIPQPKPYKSKIKSPIIPKLTEVFSKTNPLYEEETTPSLGEGEPSQSPKQINKNEQYLERLKKITNRITRSRNKKR
jgi:hypothetical protein